MVAIRGAVKTWSRASGMSRTQPPSRALFGDSAMTALPRLMSSVKLRDELRRSMSVQPSAQMAFRAMRRLPTRESLTQRRGVDHRYKR